MPVRLQPLSGSHLHPSMASYRQTTVLDTTRAHGCAKFFWKFSRKDPYALIRALLHVLCRRMLVRWVPGHEVVFPACREMPVGVVEAACEATIVP